MKRVFLIVLDSVGIGNAPDAEKFGDAGADTMKSISKSDKFHIPNLIKMGLGNIDGLAYLGEEKNERAREALTQFVVLALLLSLVLLLFSELFLTPISRFLGANSRLECGKTVAYLP